MRRVTLLWHEEEPIGICVFTTPPKSLAARTRYFGLTGRWSKWRLQALNAQLGLLSRVVVHPTYRGAGLASRFVRVSCESCPWRWIETLAELGHVHPLFERAGFVRVGVVRSVKRSRAAHSRLYAHEALVSSETHEKSRYAEPVYFVFDNRKESRRSNPWEEVEKVAFPREDDAGTSAIHADTAEGIRAVDAAGG